MSRFRRDRIGADTPAWRRARSERVADCRVFRVRRDTAVDPRGGVEHDFYVVEAPDWVNVIPLTEAGEVVMIEQYRHGSDEVTLEVPGGMVDEGETPAESAARELLEETGYEAVEMIALGRTRPNPAIQDNWQHAFLTRGARFRRDPAFDATEHCTLRLVPLADIPALIAEGVITHSLVIVAFHRFGLWRDGVTAVGD